MTVFFLLLIAHVLADFYFQPERMVERKQAHIGTLLLHSAIYLAFTLLCTIGYLTVPMSLYLLGLSAFHFLVDWIFRKKNFARLLIDQVLHVAAIAFVSYALSYHSGGFLTGVWAWAMAPRQLAVLFFILFNIRPANIFIVKLLDQCGLDTEPPGEKKPSPGAVIGSLERILTFVLILCGEYLAGTLVVAIKSIGRIKKLDDRAFSDKFIIGSLFSLMIPVLSVIAINFLS